MDLWEPIETVPRDGTPVLIWAGERFYEAKWDGEDFDPKTEDFTGRWAIRWAEIDSYGVHVDEEPTHWMSAPKRPLPKGAA